MAEINKPDFNEVKELNMGEENFREIKPKQSIMKDECDDYWDEQFEITEPDNPEISLEELIIKYFIELIEYSEYPGTIYGNEFSIVEIRNLSYDEKSEIDSEFFKTKGKLKKQWEAENGIPWPKYEEDVYFEGVMIRKKGSDYDIHHILPRCLGGKNEVDNITPLHANVHFDHKGIHAPDGSYEQIKKQIEG